MAKFELKDIGRYVIGKGAEVKLRKYIEDEMARTGHTREGIEADILNHRLSRLETDVSNIHVDPGKSREDVLVALRLMFKNCMEDYVDTDYRDPYGGSGAPRLSTGDENKIRNHFDRRYDGCPDDLVVEQMGCNINEIMTVLSRLGAEIGPLVDTSDIRSGSHNEVGADLGRMLQLMEQNGNHERMYVVKRRFGQEMKKIGLDTVKGLFMAPTYALGSIGSILMMCLNMAGDSLPGINSFLNSSKSSKYSRKSVDYAKKTGINLSNLVLGPTVKTGVQACRRIFKF